jgi:hypothetical protein
LEQVPGWTTFRNYWKKNFPKVIIPGRGEDICDKCVVFANQIRYRQGTPASVGLTEALLDENNDEVGELVDLNLDQGDMIEITKAKERKQLQSEQVILDAARHIEMEQKQRRYFQQLKKQAVENAQKAREERKYVFVADYAQNMAVPNFAGEQPGAAYYYSPLSGYVFGMIDCSTSPSVLSAHTYFEMEGKKGGNNVASMVWNELSRKGLTKRGSKTVPEIVLVFDNCPGQNKNRHVLRLLFILVGMKLCRVARAVFLVKGHTKNDCDRMYNVMKNLYREVNCYTPDDMCKFIADSSDEVELVKVSESGGFRDWDTFEDKYMNRPLGFVQFHVFTVSDNRPNVLQCQEAVGEPVTLLKIVKSQYHGKDWTANVETEVMPIPEPGLRDIKWRTMYDDYRPLIPMAKRRDFKYYSVDPGEARRKKITDNVAAAKVVRQKRTVDGMDVSAEPQQKKKATVAKKAAAPTKKKAAPRKRPRMF